MSMATQDEVGGRAGKRRQLITSGGAVCQKEVVARGIAPVTGWRSSRSTSDKIIQPRDQQRLSFMDEGDRFIEQAPEAMTVEQTTKGRAVEAGPVFPVADDSQPVGSSWEGIEKFSQWFDTPVAVDCVAGQHQEVGLHGSYCLEQVFFETIDSPEMQIAELDNPEWPLRLRHWCAEFEMGGSEQLGLDGY